MRNISRFYISIIAILFICFLLFTTVQACKDIIACNEATEGDYNLLLKVRDPSRKDYQVLTIIPEGYRYSYHHPWSGKTMDFEFKHKTIGVVSYGDTPPNIVKPGMCFTDAGLAFGDADTITNWRNPTRYGWDDFDWIRYACQTANNEPEAVTLLTEEVVDKYHAPSVPENLFVVGPNECYVIEADVLHYDVKKVDRFVVRTNYAKELWDKSLVYLSKAKSFDTTFEDFVRKGRTIRLGFLRLYGIKILDIGDNWIEVKQVPIQLDKGNIIGTSFDLFSKNKINLEEGKNIGFFWVELKEIEGNKAKVFVSYKYKTWETKMNEIIQQKLGSINVSDMMNWSRIHSEDLGGLRSMCGEKEAYKYEGDMIYKIPSKNYEILSEGWFSPNHACSSIYVPVHICVTDIYDPYETGEVAQICLDLLEEYGHGILSQHFGKVEQVFINEMELLEDICLNLIDENGNVSDFLTVNDIGMQKQGFLTEKIWLKASKSEYRKDIIEILEDIWDEDYKTSLSNMKEGLVVLKDIPGSYSIRTNIKDIALGIVKSRIDAAEKIGRSTEDVNELYQKSKSYLENEEYETGFKYLKQAFAECNMLLDNNFGHSMAKMDKTQFAQSTTISYFFILLLAIFSIFIVSFLFVKKR